MTINIYGQKKFNIQELDSLNKNGEFKLVIELGKEKLKSLNSYKKHKTEFFIGNAYENLNKEDSAFVYYKYALEGFKALDFKDDIAKVNLDIYSLLRSQNNLNSNSEKYFTDFFNYAKSTNSKDLLATAYNYLGMDNFRDKDSNIPKNYFNKALKLHEELNNTDLQVQVLSNLGVLYRQKFKNLDSAKYFYYKALEIYEADTSKNKNLNTKFNLYNNLGNTYKKEKKYLKAIEIYKKAESLDIKKYKLKSTKKLYSNIDISYYYLKDWKKAYSYLYKYDSIKDLINLKDQNALISDIQEKYDNEKLRADNLEIESKRKQNKNLLFAAMTFILFGSITAFLIQKNTRKKQKLAEQEKALETQKLATVLKEQELIAIDAMIEGQEKERQRIANDLHDDLGGLMATVKLHFNALNNEKKAGKLFEKTNDLLDEAYNKIRSIAHAKNSGVIAKQGLLIAVQNMADKISVSNKINIEVIDHGLENRLENSLELTIFRIIQELVTNIIKHAEATEANIHLTNHDNTINIMIEDNGKGFNPNQVTTKHKGMGINSIDKRVEHLDGKMTIESELNKGTTIIIDIPL